MIIVTRVSPAMRRCLLLPLLLGLASSAPADDLATVTLTKTENTIEVRIGQRELTTYHFGKDLPKPFFSPVRTPGNNVITRPLEKPEDHPHHKGIWLSIDEVNDIKFWAEKGKIENVSAELPVANGVPAVLRVVNHWQGTDGKPVLVEKTDISIWPNSLFVYDVRFEAAAGKVTFGDTKEGMFGIRLADPLREKVGGHVVNADGKRTTKQCWGQESAWVDYWGALNNEVCGAALFDHPGNFRKSRYHVRDYGLFTISPFGQNSYTNGMLPADPFVLDNGQAARLRYGLYIHSGDTEAGKVVDAYQQFLNATAE